MDELQARGFETGSKPGQEDFGWYFRFRVGEADYDLVIGHRPGEDGEPGDWICTIERGAGFLASIFGARKRGIPQEAAQAIHAALSSSPQITGIRWHTDEDMRTEANGSDTPVG
jgi:hypothetical protein